ncbi:MAG: hypothetical protein U1F00_00560 [Rhodoferax sp.]
MGKAGWNRPWPATADPGGSEVRQPEIFLDSDTQVALISGSGSEEPRDWFLTNEMKADARAEESTAVPAAGEMFSHAIFMPGMPGWLDKVDRDLELLQPTRSRATRWVTTPTSIWPATPDAWTTRSCSTARSTKKLVEIQPDAAKPQPMSACTRGSFPSRCGALSDPGAVADVRDVACRRRTGHS